MQNVIAVLSICAKCDRQLEKEICGQSRFNVNHVSFQMDFVWICVTVTTQEDWPRLCQGLSIHFATKATDNK